MPKLFIANCTKQVLDFHYRIPEFPQVYQVIIKPGSQQRIHKDDLSVDTIDYIINQHVMYGLVPSNEIDRTKPFIGLCYSVDKEIRAESIMKALKHNAHVLEVNGYEQRVESAAAISSALDTQAEENGMAVDGVSVEVIEQEQPGHEARDGERISETVTVDKSLPTARTSSNNKTRASQRTRGR